MFEDLEPRLADLDGDGHDEIVVVKSYLSAAPAGGGRLAQPNTRSSPRRRQSRPHAWLNPAVLPISATAKPTSLVRCRTRWALELWTWADKRLRKTSELAGTSNHIAGTRALDMAATADFDGDGIADLAVPSFERDRLRIVAFTPAAHEIASVALPAKAATNIALVTGGAGPPMIAVGLSDGSLVVIRRD